MNSKESEVLKENIRLKLDKINVRYKTAADKKRQEKLFEKINMILSKTFNAADLHEHHPIKQLIQRITRGQVILKRQGLM